MVNLVRWASLMWMIGFAAGCGDSDSLASEPFQVHKLTTPAGFESEEPHLTVGEGGVVVMSWLEPQDSGHALRYSTLKGEHWSPASTVALGRDWFVNWADFPSVVPITSSLWAAHWLAKKPGGTYAYDVAIAMSSDGGRSWAAPFTPHTDGTRTEHGFVSLFPWKTGTGAVWLDGRNMVEDGEQHGSPDPTAGMTLRFAMLTPEGANVSGQVIDELVCDCCQTDVALTAEGPVVVYRNRTRVETRDINIVRSVDWEWQTPQLIADDGWHIAGCPVNGPAIDARGLEAAVAWFTAADDRPRVSVALSEDAGKTFGPPIDIDAEGALGRVDVELLSQGGVVVSWLRNAGEGIAEVCLRGISGNGRLGPIRVLTATEASRPAGFPQMVLDGGRLIFAWTQISEDERRVRTATIDIDALL